MAAGESATADRQRLEAAELPSRVVVGLELGPEAGPGYSVGLGRDSSLN